MSRFNHLNVPQHWENYWSKYPNGYTILEALIQWVQQVDNMVDNQNVLNTTVQNYRKELDAFIEQFDPNLKNKVVEILGEWQASGFLEVIIDEALQTQIDDVSDLSLETRVYVDEIRNNELLRNIHIIADDPDNMVGENGDIWLHVMPPAAYYYEGVERSKWVNGVMTGVSETSKESDHMRINTKASAAIGVSTLVTDAPVDLTNIKTLYVEWANDGNMAGGPPVRDTVQSRLNISTDKLGDTTVRDATLLPSIDLQSGTFTRKRDSISVATLNGFYYLRFHARTANTTSAVSNLKVYRVWGV